MEVTITLKQSNDDIFRTSLVFTGICTISNIMFWQLTDYWCTFFHSLWRVFPPPAVLWLKPPLSEFLLGIFVDFGITVRSSGITALLVRPFLKFLPGFAVVTIRWRFRVLVIVFLLAVSVRRQNNSTYLSAAGRCPLHRWSPWVPHFCSSFTRVMCGELCMTHCSFWVTYALFCHGGATWFGCFQMAQLFALMQKLTKNPIVHPTPKWKDERCI